MNRLLLGLALAVFIIVAAPFAGMAGLATGLAVSEPKGVYCEINEVKLFAQSAEDCQKAGGTVTHTVTTTVVPAGDNPDQEPEIQRGKDKEPEAP